MTGFDVNRLIAARSQHGKEIKPSKSLFAGHRIEEGVGQRYNVRSESDDVVVYPPGIFPWRRVHRTEGTRTWINPFPGHVIRKRRRTLGLSENEAELWSSIETRSLFGKYFQTIRPKTTAWSIHQSTCQLRFGPVRHFTGERLRRCYCLPLAPTVLGLYTDQNTLSLETHVFPHRHIFTDFV